MKLICETCGSLAPGSEGKTHAYCGGTLREPTGTELVLVKRCRALSELSEARGAVIDEERVKVAKVTGELREALAGAAGIERKVLDGLLWAGSRMRERLPDEMFVAQSWDETLANLDAVYPRIA